MKKILAYCFHEHERDLCTRLFENRADHGAIVTGNVDENQLQQLSSAGIIFKVLDDKSDIAPTPEGEGTGAPSRQRSIMGIADSSQEAAGSPRLL
jgi:hypothetical protein